MTSPLALANCRFVAASWQTILAHYPRRWLAGGVEDRRLLLDLQVGLGLSPHQERAAPIQERDQEPDAFDAQFQDKIVSTPGFRCGRCAEAAARSRSDSVTVTSVRNSPILPASRTWDARASDVCSTITNG
jgi:hypothetical protein